MISTPGGRAASSISICLSSNCPACNFLRKTFLAIDFSLFLSSSAASLLVDREGGTKQSKILFSAASKT